MNTFFALMAEYETAEIPLEKICEKYFNMSIKTAEDRAARARLPVPAYKAGSAKSQWLISAQVLADHLDKCRKAANDEWVKRNVA